MNSQMKRYIEWGLEGTQSTGASVPMELGYTTFPAHRCVHWPRSSLNPILFGFPWRLHHIIHDQSLTQSPAPLSFLENGGWGQKFQASNHRLVFLVTNTHPEGTHEPTKSHLIRIKDTPITQEISRDLEAELGADIYIWNNKFYNK